MDQQISPYKPKHNIGDWITDVMLGWCFTDTWEIIDIQEEQYILRRIYDKKASKFSCAAIDTTGNIQKVDKLHYYLFSSLD